MEAKKFIESRKEGDYEIKKFHVIDIDFVTKIDLEYYSKQIFNLDSWPEDAYEKGFNIGPNDEIWTVDIKKFLKAIDGDKDELDTDDLEFIEKLIKYKDYTLYC
jgi:hypothetical protein